jgi:hypothetical protein
VSITGLRPVDDCNTLLPPEVVRSSNQKEGTAIDPPASRTRAHVVAAADRRRCICPTTRNFAVPASTGVKLAHS